MISAALLVVLSPIMVSLCVVIALSMGWPPLFCQTRAGLHGKPFTIVKFRTMHDRRGVDGRLLPDKDRLSRLGALLRSSSLDETPELVNVLRGEMSLVGPRPLLLEYVERYGPVHAQRLEVKPGITGLAQVSGRNSISWEQRFDLDVYYVDNISLWLDIKILFLTVWKVIRAEGISARGHATMPPFTG